MPAFFEDPAGAQIHPPQRGAQCAAGGRRPGKECERCLARLHASRMAEAQDRGSLSGPAQTYLVGVTPLCSSAKREMQAHASGAGPRLLSGPVQICRLSSVV